jgi:predicted unusual protein kinase regulating ubiquinone biosynthesis (AarF/ABC1/UbiB family)
VRAMLKREVTYGLELEMLEFFGQKLAHDPRYIVPRPYPEFSAKRVLAMSFEEGMAIDGPEVAALPQERRNALAQAVLELYFRELFEWRRVQTDPHFGNFRVRLGKGKTAADQLVLLDFGAVRDLPKAFMEKYAKMLSGTFHGNRALFEAAGAELGVLDPKDPQELKDLFYKLCLGITEPFLEPQPFDWSGSDLPQRVSKDGWEIFKRFPLRAPPRELIFLDRKMAGIFTLMVKLGARIDARSVLKPYLVG